MDGRRMSELKESTNLPSSTFRSIQTPRGLDEARPPTLVTMTFTQSTYSNANLSQKSPYRPVLAAILAFFSPGWLVDS